MNRNSEVTFKVLFLLFLFSVFLFVILALKSCSLITETAEKLRTQRAEILNVDILRPSR